MNCFKLSSKFILSILFLSSFIKGQDNNQSQSIELPDFVITGVQSINLPVMKKKKPAFYSLLSKDFFKPEYSPEEFLLSKITKPEKVKINLFQNDSLKNGRLILGAGVYSLPVGSFFFNKSFKRALFYTNVYGSNISDYVDNAGFNVSGASMGTDFFISNLSSFLPGLKISVRAAYQRQGYRFFGSQTPEIKRETESGNVSLGFINTLNPIVSYGLEFKGDLFNFKENGMSENQFFGHSFLELRFSKFGLKWRGFIEKSEFKNFPFSLSNKNFVGGEFKLKLKPYKTFVVNLGVYYAEQDSSSFFSPTASVGFELDKNISLFGEFSPNAEFLTASDLIKQNRYLVIDSAKTYFIKNKNNFKIGIRYQYDIYFELSGGIGYKKTTGNVHFEDINKPGRFEVQIDENTKRFLVFFNYYFHLGPYGELYGEAEYQNFINDADKIIPYEPPVRANINYRYFFNFGFALNIKFSYINRLYADGLNTKQIKDYMNLSLGLKYELVNNFSATLDLQNILNRKNYLLFGYQEKPLDLILGIEYRW